MKNKLTIGLILLSLFTACASDTDDIQDETNIIEVTNDVELLSSITIEYKEDDLLMEYTDFEVITLESSSISYTGSNATIDETTLTITKAGTYKVIGTLDDGMIVVNAGQEEDVVIVLDNATIHNENGPAISVLQADKVIINLAEGSSNSLTDGSSYALQNGEDEPNATLYSKDDLTINGLGSLTINSNYNHGIYTKDDLKLVSGNITVNAINDGIKGKNFIAIKDANITVNAHGDGLQSNNTEDTTKGYIVIDGGNIMIIAGLDGIQAETQLVVSDGTISIESGSEADSSESGKSLKATVQVEILGGDITLNSLSDDAIHSNNTVIMKGGNLTLNAYDDAIHSDSLLQIDDGTINILSSYEGLEGNTIIINGGDIELIASDDGVNTAGGNDSSGSTSLNGREDMFASDGSSLTINGGNLVVNANGDGLDSNGSIVQNGGIVIVYGPTNSGNGALDYNSSYTLNAGTLLAVGSNGMAQNVSESQIYAFLLGTNTIQADTWVSIVQDDKTLISFKSPKIYQTIVYASNELTNSDVSIESGGTLNTTESYIINTPLNGGTELITLTLTDIITNSNVVATSTPGQKPKRSN